MAFITCSFTDGDVVLSAIQPIMSRPRFWVSLKYWYWKTMKLVSACGLLPVKMPAMVKSQVREPFRWVKMLLMIGTRSPTFQPHFFAMASPTSALVRSRRKACRAPAAWRSVVVDRHVTLRLDREHDQEVLRVLIVAAEPVEMRELPHAFDARARG